MPVNSDKIVSAIPLGKVFKLVGHLIAFASKGISKEEGAILLEDLAEIAASLAISLSK